MINTLKTRLMKLEMKISSTQGVFIYQKIDGESFFRTWEGDVLTLEDIFEAEKKYDHVLKINWV